MLLRPGTWLPRSCSGATRPAVASRPQRPDGPHGRVANSASSSLASVSSALRPMPMTVASSFTGPPAGAQVTLRRDTPKPPVHGMPLPDVRPFSFPQPRVSHRMSVKSWDHQRCTFAIQNLLAAAWKDTPPSGIGRRWSSGGHWPLRHRGRQDVGHVVFDHVVNTDRATCGLTPSRGGHQRPAPRRRRPSTSTACAARACRPSSRQPGILLGDCDVAIGSAGTCPAPLRPSWPRFGRAHGDTQDGRHDGRRPARPFHTIHMGVTAENVARVRHQPRAAGRPGAGEPPPRRVAWAEAASRTRSSPSCSRPARARSPSTGTSISAPTPTGDDFQKMKAVFVQKRHRHRRQRKNGINDAAAAVLLMEARRQGTRTSTAGPPGGLRPRQAWSPRSWASARCRPRKVLKRTGLTVNDQIDVISPTGLRRPGLRRDQRPGAPTPQRSAPMARAHLAGATPSAPPAR